MPVSLPQPVGSHSNARRPARVVGIGASAGGLEALEQFLAQVPAGSGLAYVVVQHLDPTHKAMLAELLQRATPMPVREATDGLAVVADAVYVIPPNSELSLRDGLLHLTAPKQPRGLRLPIDVLLCSLARELGDAAVGVVLSGMGSDGTVGLQAIKTQGGLSLAQLPASALFDSMPASAIAAGCVDIVAPPAELPLRILRVTARRDGEGPAPGPAPNGEPQVLESILELLREHSRHDLSQYKPSTLRRRIERRMGVHGQATMVDYERLLRNNPQELELLFKEMLIGVTSFFRDPAVWQELKDRVLTELLAEAGVGRRLRAWVVGCSTGEEAYTLAIAFREAAEAHGQPGLPSMQIFATDLSADAIAAARKGLYPARIASDLTPERLERHFSAHADGYLIDKNLREMVLFAQHDVILDPPFTRLDVLCCRNLMIYFGSKLQRRLLPLFHYSLRRGGALLLGGSETVGSSLALFTALSPKSRLYRRSDNAASASAVDFPIQRRLLAQLPEPTLPLTSHPSTNLQAQADQALLREFSPPAVLVNEQGDIVYINGRTGRYLEPAAGKANWNIYVMLRPAIRAQVAAALRQVLQDRKTVELHGLRLDDEALRLLDVTVQAMNEPQALAGTLMLVFRETAAVPAVKARRRRSASALDPAIADELARSSEEIRALRQEMGAAAEELQAANEELQSTNEELQSANEELTTSKEESQSMNEELQTLNGELQSKLDDLALSQSDMQNLLNSTDIATLFLDSALNVRRYTEQITRIIHLREGDVGRPLSDLASTLIYPQLHDDAKETLRTLSFSEKQIATTDGHWYAVRIKPYRTLTNVIQGVVITLVDITAAKELESRLRKG